MRIAKSERHNLWINIGVTDATGKGVVELLFPLLEQIWTRNRTGSENLPRSSSINYRLRSLSKRNGWEFGIEKNTGERLRGGRSGQKDKKEREKERKERKKKQPWAALRSAIWPDCGTWIWFSRTYRIWSKRTPFIPTEEFNERKCVVAGHDGNSKPDRIFLPS